MSRIIGIDFGTSNLRVAVVRNAAPQVVENAYGARTTPSVVAYGENNERQVGEIAKRKSLLYPDATVSSIKRLLGGQGDVPSGQMFTLPYAADGAVHVDVRGRGFAPEQVAAALLQQAKITAEAYLYEPVTQAVITSPNGFNYARRQAIIDSGEIAGLEVVRVINDTTAAALAYGFGNKQDIRTVAVYALGGGACSFSVVEIGHGLFEVKSTTGDALLGGDDFDLRLVAHLVAEFKKENQIDLTHDKTAVQRLKDATEKAKIELSSVQQTELNLPCISLHPQTGSPLHLTKKVTRGELEGIVSNLVGKTKELCGVALKDAGITAAKIDEIVLVGGMTRMPLVKQAVREFFGKEPTNAVNPDEACVLGAAIQGGILKGDIKNIMPLEVLPHAFGLENSKGTFTPFILRNTLYPTRISRIVSTTRADFDVKVVKANTSPGDVLEPLGQHRLSGLPSRRFPWQRQVNNEIEVTFDVDANARLSVTARIRGADAGQAVLLKSPRGLSAVELKRFAAGEQTFLASANEEFAGTQAAIARPLLNGYRAPAPYRKGIRSCVVCDLTWRSTIATVKDENWAATFAPGFRLSSMYNEENLLGLVCTNCKRGFCKKHLNQGIPYKLPGGVCPACGAFLDLAWPPSL